MVLQTEDSDAAAEELGPQDTSPGSRHRYTRCAWLFAHCSTPPPVAGVPGAFQGRRRRIELHDSILFQLSALYARTHACVRVARAWTTAALPHGRRPGRFRPRSARHEPEALVGDYLDLQRARWCNALR